MSTITLKASDISVRDTVVRQLEWDPEVDAAAIGVSAHDGAVTLTGFIDSYAGKLAAERAAKRGRGVRAVANDIQVRLKLPRTDEDIAYDAARALALHVTLPKTVQATVHNGHITLTGTVPWSYQRSTAEIAIRHLAGIAGVVNRIEVVPESTLRDVRHRITESLHQMADINAKHIVVSVHGTEVTLTGTVASWAQRDAAQYAAEAAPGVTAVHNLIDVKPADFDTADTGEIC
jgi:osmotically-inducible protein OsmY